MPNNVCESTLYITVQNFQISQYLTKNYISKFFGKLKILKSPEGLELMTYRLVAKPLIHCATLLGDKFGKEIIH